MHERKEADSAALSQKVQLGPKQKQRLNLSIICRVGGSNVSVPDCRSAYNAQQEARRNHCPPKTQTRHWHPRHNITWMNKTLKKKKWGGKYFIGDWRYEERPFRVCVLQPESCPLWQKRTYRSLNSTIGKSPGDSGPHFWSVMRLVRALTFLTDSEMFSNMRSFTFSWSITGLLARRTQSADSLDAQERLFCYSKLTPPAQASWHAKHG